MTEGMWVALITTGGTVVVGLIGIALELLRRELKGIKQDTSVTAEQVSNSHEENFRVEMTRQFDEVKARQDREAALRIAANVATNQRLDRLDERVTNHIDGV